MFILRLLIIISSVTEHLRCDILKDRTRLTLHQVLFFIICIIVREVQYVDSYCATAYYEMDASNHFLSVSICVAVMNNQAGNIRCIWLKDTLNE